MMQFFEVEVGYFGDALKSIHSTDSYFGDLCFTALKELPEYFYGWSTAFGIPEKISGFKPCSNCVAIFIYLKKMMVRHLCSGGEGDSRRFLTKVKHCLEKDHKSLLDRTFNARKAKFLTQKIMVAADIIRLLCFISDELVFSDYGSPNIVQVKSRLNVMSRGSVKPLPVFYSGDGIRAVCQALCRGLLHPARASVSLQTQQSIAKALGVKGQDTNFIIPTIEDVRGYVVATEQILYQLFDAGTTYGTTEISGLSEKVFGKEGDGVIIFQGSCTTLNYETHNNYTLFSTLTYSRAMDAIDNTMIYWHQSMVHRDDAACFAVPF